MSNYHAFLVSWNKRFSALQLTANYSYSKSLDQYGTSQDDATFAPDSFNLNFNYGPSAFDHRHLFSTMWLYELPFAKSRRWSAGWWMSGIFFANSGEPMDVTANYQGYGGGTTFQYPIAAIPLSSPQLDNGVHRAASSSGIGLAGGPAMRGSGLNRFADPAATYRNFRSPRLSSDTRSGRGALRDFINWNVDLSVGKSTRLRERLKLGFSMEFLNAFNHVIWQNPDLQLQNPAQFGVLSRQWNAPRTLQAGTRLEW
jgi:hypothetical protein